MSVPIALLPPTIQLRMNVSTHAEYFYEYQIEVIIANPNTLSNVELSAHLCVKSQDGTIVIYDDDITAANTFTFDVTDYPEVPVWVASVTDAYFTWESETAPRTIADVTETVSDIRLRPVSTFDKTAAPSIILKAFCNFPGNNYDTLYGRWEVSSDGITWEELSDANLSHSYISEVIADIVPVYDTFGNLVVDEEVPPVYVAKTFYKLLGGGVNGASFPESPKDNLNYRYDCILCASSLSGKQLRFRMVTIDTENTKVIESSSYPTVKLELGQSIYFPVYASKTEVLDSDFPSASLGTPLYHNRTLYTYGVKSEQAIVYASEVGSLVRPLSRVLDLDSSASDVVTALIPWRDYLIAATEHSLHLIRKADTGFTSKIINPAIGIPQADAKCCIPVLNGVIFKSGNRIFQLYPNIYSGEDTVLNVSDISKPIERYLIPATDAFAFSSEEAYYLMLIQDDETECWKYNYVFKTWVKFQYPFVASGYTLRNISDIRIYGTSEAGWGMFVIERDLDELVEEANVPETVVPNLLYGDYVNSMLSDTESDSIGENVCTPIPYLLDTGQKTDNISYTKQFTEAKFIFVTEHAKDRFPCQVLVQVDGDFRTIKINVNTDSAFWVSATNFASQPLTLGTDIYSNDADLLNTFRHLFLRYSGKGRSVRFRLIGYSVYRFRIHGIMSRYRMLNVKQ